MKDKLLSWYDSHEEIVNSELFNNIRLKTGEELANHHRIEPHLSDIFNAYKMTPIDTVKVVILGQDPYPNGEGHGLAFSSHFDKLPASLRIIFNELKNSLNIERTNPCLIDWAKQGVMLLNTHLTTRSKQPLAHSHWGWDKFTSHTLKTIYDLEQPVIFMLWGNAAQKQFSTFIPNSYTENKLILKSIHPAAQLYSGGKTKFVGNNHFKLANEFLVNNGLTQINW